MAETKKTTSIKHVQINRSQSTMLAIIAAATVVVVFSLFATKTLIVKGAYQRRALHARKDVVTKLFDQYKVFADQDPNFLGGTLKGGTNLDGDNPRLVLDALPSKYDAPALASSVEKLLQGENVSISSLSVKDDPAGNSDQPQPEPIPTPMAFSFEGTTSYPTAALLLADFERSIRPFDLNTLEISGTDSQLKLTVGMTTYFQAAKSLNLKPTVEVK
jgi:hypothetical protein